MDLPDQSGRRALVTGATGGLGHHVCLELARAGASVVLAARDEAAAAAGADQIRAQVPGARLEVLRLDLADLSSVHEAAERAASSYERLDLLVNNAGVMATPYRRTVDGFELQLGTNHLGHFALTGLLLPLLGQARVVTVSSLLHRRADAVWLGGPRLERGYSRWGAYAESKLANLLFARELDRRARRAGLGLTSVAAHPGFTDTGLQRTGPQLGGRNVMSLALRGVTAVVGQPAAAGAMPILYAATAPGLGGGAYAGPSGLGEARGAPRLVDMSAAASDTQAAGALWELSEQATGVSYH